MPPQLLQACLLNVLMAKRPIKTAIDLGCGNGAFALMAAALGWSSYGIDASPVLVRKACQLRDLLRQQGLILAEVTCEFVQGSIYPGAWQADYQAFVAAEAKNDVTMPVVKGDAYVSLGIALDEIDMIYAFTWSDQMPFLCRYLAAAAAPNATFYCRIIAGLRVGLMKTCICLVCRKECRRLFLSRFGRLVSEQATSLVFVSAQRKALTLHPLNRSQF